MSTPDDARTADDIEAVLCGATKADLGDARYQRMRYRLRRPHVRAIAQRIGLDPTPRITETVIDENGERKTIVMTGALPLLPYGTPLPGWKPCYRTEGAASLGVSPASLERMGCEVLGKRSRRKR